MLTPVEPEIELVLRGIRIEADRLEPIPATSTIRLARQRNDERVPAPAGNERHKTLLLLILINIAASVLHYVDNILFFGEYPEPPWISTFGIGRFWFVMTPFAVLGYYLFRRRRFLMSSLALYAYSLMGLAALGHYLYAPLNTIPWRIHTFILLEAAAAFALIGHVIVLQRQRLAVPGRFPAGAPRATEAFRR